MPNRQQLTMTIQRCLEIRGLVGPNPIRISRVEFFMDYVVGGPQFRRLTMLWRLGDNSCAECDGYQQETGTPR
jgi:hypothetical protein